MAVLGLLTACSHHSSDSQAQNTPLLADVSGVWRVAPGSAQYTLNLAGSNKTFMSTLEPGMVYSASMEEVNPEKKGVTLQVIRPAPSGSNMTYQPLRYQLRLQDGADGHKALAAVLPGGQRQTWQYVRPLDAADKEAVPTRIVSTGQGLLTPAPGAGMAATPSLTVPPAASLTVPPTASPERPAEKEKPAKPKQPAVPHEPNEATPAPADNAAAAGVAQTPATPKPSPAPAVPQPSAPRPPVQPYTPAAPATGNSAPQPDDANTSGTDAGAAGATGQGSAQRPDTRCAGIRSPYRRALCISPDFRQADAMLNQRFREAMGALPPNERPRLRYEEDDWAAYKDRLCQGDPQCLARMSRERAGQLGEQY